MKECIIQTQDLVHTYPTGVTALKGVNLSIYRNDKISIIGQNGSGKTTIVRHFNGLLKPTSGKVLLYGTDTTQQKVGEMSRKVGYVFQNPSHQMFCTTVKDELEAAPKNFGFTAQETKDAVEEVVELMNIKDVLNVHPLTLDYTTKKIVTIASVLTFKPDVLILDEPTGGLDEAGRVMLTNIIEMMHRNGHTVIMISHDMDYVAENSDRIIVMCEGEIIDDGVPEDIFLNAPVLQRAQLEPPQITQLDLYLENGNQSRAILSVKDFVDKYKQNIN
jgi:energy-coupling factor transport system ATP-binding protein